MTLEPGDVRWYRARPPGGGPAPKDRPVLIISVGPTGDGQDEVVVYAPITSAPRRVARLYHGDIDLPNWEALGLSRPSVVRCRQFQAVPQKWVAEKVGSVDYEVLCRAREIARALLDE